MKFNEKFREKNSDFEEPELKTEMSNRWQKIKKMKPRILMHVSGSLLT